VGTGRVSRGKKLGLECKSAKQGKTIKAIYAERCVQGKRKKVITVSAIFWSSSEYAFSCTTGWKVERRGGAAVCVGASRSE
jgi:hypothetical protein